jgi:hypothetical protein
MREEEHTLRGKGRASALRAYAAVEPLSAEGGRTVFLEDSHGRAARLLTCPGISTSHRVPLVATTFGSAPAQAERLLDA